jgi:Cu-processing system ATP-binding protein
MISIKKVNKKFGKLQALDNVSLELESGRSYAFIGPNGSGKTTLIKSVLGMVIPTSGEICVDGKSILNDWKYREKIGYMPQIGKFPDNMRIGQLIDMMKNIRQHNETLDDQLIDEFKLYKIYDKPMHTLSGGTRQKVSAALAFLFNPAVLILDEPTAGLDPVSVEILKEKIIEEKEKGKLMLITSHILNDLDELSTEVIYIIDGKVQYDNSIEVLKEETGEKRLSKAIVNMIKQKKLLESIVE